MKYAGSCHCGKIAYEVEGEAKEATECNCSICRRRGSLLWFLPRDQLKLKAPESDMSYYSFNKHHIKHYFCPVCGCAPFGLGAGPDGKPMAAVNLRCLPEVDLASVKINHFDGASR